MSESFSVHRVSHNGFSIIYLNREDYMNRRKFFKSIIGATAGFGMLGAIGFGKYAQKNRPNIVLIMADDLGQEVLEAYGGTSYHTPNIDKLAEGGVRFTHCYSTPVCSPSRVKLMTGRYGFRTTDKWGYLPSDEVTFGTLLQRAGYKTALAGKWQMGLLKDNPHHVTENGFQANCCWGWSEGPRYWQPLIWQNGKIRKDVEDRYGPEVFTEFLTDFMRENQEAPFFVYYPMVLTHFPYTPRFSDGPAPTAPNKKHYETFAEMVSKADEMVGRIVGTLDELGLRENTVILFTGDNGTPSSVVSKVGDTCVRGGKGSLKDAGTRVPLIVNWPGTTPAGGVCDDLIDFSDFMPTLAELAGARLPRGVTIDGRSFASQVKGQNVRGRAWAFNYWGSEGNGWIRTHRFKLYLNGELYDVAQDPLEPPSVLILEKYDTEESAAVRKNLQRVIDSFPL